MITVTLPPKVRPTNEVLHALPIQFINIGVEFWANHMGENPGTIGNILMNVDGNSLEALMRRHWEQEAKKSLPFKKKKTGPLIPAR